MYALVFNGKVQQVSDHKFDIHSSAEWVEFADGEVEDGDLYSVDGFSKPVQPAVEYNVARAAEYPPVAELIVAMWEDLVESGQITGPQTTALQALRAEIKAKYPKDNV